MEGLILIPGYLDAVFSWIFPLGWLFGPRIPQSLPYGGVHNTSASSPPAEIHGGGQNIADSASRANNFSSSLPAETHGSDFTGSAGEANSSLPPTEDPRSKFTTHTSGPFLGAHDFVINNPAITVLQGDSNAIAQGIKALSERVIKGAAYDSSLRDPPPQCHPGTRVQLREKITTWFRNNDREKALLWLNGPAGVGKSAVIQTVAESLAESNSVGATLFFSRLNGRNDPQRVFITIAYQLVTEIPTYKTYIMERMAVDPGLLEKGMKDQFRIFITEPFGNEKIGKGKGPWAVLLDGLDECEGVEEQSRIMRLVSEFVLAFPDAPLVWVIASRPEPHITATFKDEAVSSSYWSEYVPVDSTQACQDVEHYLDASFKTMRKQFPHLPSDWPSETQFLKLTRGALGLFAFARTAVRFMEDPNYADPVSRLGLLISIIDRLDVKVIDDHPFALLDALYTQILTSIPPSVWCTTKPILGFIICTQSSNTQDGLSYPLNPQKFMGASIILGLELSVIYGSLYKLHSVLNIPRSELANYLSVTFLHASFGDYLTDQARSKDFYIDRGECVDDITRSLFRLYLNKPWDTDWVQYTSRPPSTTASDLKREAETSLHYMMTGELRSWRGSGPFKSQEDRSECLRALDQINPVDVYKCGGLTGRTAKLLIALWDTFREELERTGLFKEVSPWDLRMEYLNLGRNKPFFSVDKDGIWIEDFLGSREDVMNAREKYLQWRPQKRRAIIYGGLCERIAFFEGVYDGQEGCLCFLYPY